MVEKLSERKTAGGSFYKKSEFHEAATRPLKAKKIVINSWMP
jgi:hypothetical protein